jgi:hypothetical protein
MTWELIVVFIGRELMVFFIGRELMVVFIGRELMVVFIGRGVNGCLCLLPLSAVHIAPLIDHVIPNYPLTP